MEKKLKMLDKVKVCKKTAPWNANYDSENNDSMYALHPCCFEWFGFWTNFIWYCSICLTLFCCVATNMTNFFHQLHLSWFKTKPVITKFFCKNLYYTQTKKQEKSEKICGVDFWKIKKKEIWKLEEFHSTVFFLQFCTYILLLLLNNFLHIDVDVLERELDGHPSRILVNTLINSLRYGIHAGYTGPHKPRVSRNLISANQQPDVVTSNLCKEISRVV